MAESGAVKKPGALESLSKEELVGKCKTLLQIAQKAKKAKDEIQKEKEILQEEGVKEKDDFLEQISVLKSNIDDNEDIVKAKQRQLDRLSEENDSLLEQINTYSTQLRIITKEKVKTEEDIKATKDALIKSEKQAAKAKEHEASLICFKEQGTQMTNKLKMIEQELAAEKIMGNDKNNQIKTLEEKLKLSKEKHADDQKIVQRGNELEMVKKLLEEKESSIEHLESARFQIEKENIEISQKNTGLIEELNQLNQEMKKRGEKIEKLEKINTDQHMKIKNLEQLNSEQTSQSETVDNIRHQYEEAEKLLRQALVEKENLSEQLVKYKTETNTFINREKEFKDQLDEFTIEKKTLAKKCE